MQNFIERHLKRKSLLSMTLYPLSLIFTLIQVFRRKLYKFRKVYHSNLKVISVGNITAGGTGKTPFTIFLAQKMKAAGIKVAVSHRGYKGNFENENQIISDNDGLKAEAFDAGDEALLLAEKLIGIPVIAGKNRTKSLQILTSEFPELEVVILDDSFQHLKVKHDHDFVIFNQAGGIGNGFLLPAGILREPLSALKYADTIIYNGEGDIPQYLNKYQTRVLQGHYLPSGLFINNETEIDINQIKKAKLMLASGIGNPASFENTLHEMGLKWLEHIIYPDHYHYDQTVILKLNEQLKLNKPDYLLTTEKDYTKLRKAEIRCPIVVLRIKFQLDKDQDIIKLLF